jgi:phage shock protein A
MFRAIGRFFRSLGYFLTGKIDTARGGLSTSPEVIRATYDSIVEEKKKRLRQYKDAVAAMIAQEEKKAAELKTQTEEVTKLGKLREGAAAMARKVVERHHGDIDAVRRDPDYVKCQAAFKDFGSTLEEKEKRCQELEADVNTIHVSIAQHKNELLNLLREIEKIKQEKHETVADLMTAREEKELADMMVGISEDRASRELQELRDLRSKAKADARVAREVAGLDAKHLEDEFLEYAAKSAVDNEFDALIGLTKQEPKEGEAEGPEKTRIPEG